MFWRRSNGIAYVNKVTVRRDRLRWVIIHRYTESASYF